MVYSLIKNTIGIYILLSLTACGGGGGADGTLNPSNKYPVVNLDVTFEAYNNQYSGINESGVKVIDATPFNQRTIISVKLTNNLTYPIFDGRAYPLGGYPVWSNNEYLTKPVTVSNPDIIGERIGRISYFYVESTDVRFTKIVTPDWCGYYTKQNPLQSNHSCVSYISIDWTQNYDTTESINLPIGYSFTALNPAFPIAQDGVRYSSQYQTDALCKLNPNTCLPILYAPTKIGRWYVGEQGYDFAGNNVNGGVIANTEPDGDYLYLNSNQKIKLIYDINNVAQLDFSLNFTNCPVPGCYISGLFYDTVRNVSNIKGLDTLDYYYENYTPNGGFYSTKVYRYSYPMEVLIPNISEIRAIQPDGTLIGKSSINGQYGCFDNDGSNFRPFEQLYGWQVGHLNGTSWNVTYDQSNWVPVRSTDQQQFWKVIADNTGKCQLDPVNSFIFDAIMYSQAGNIAYRMLTPQITKNGVFAENIINEKLYLKFYKYPSAQNSY